jgi:tape measure domain-containing protein
MAVEIPVVIDIDGAFEDAAKRIRQDMKQLQDAVDKNAVKIRVDNTSIKDFNAELEALNEWYRELESAEWSKIGQKLDLGPTINRAILELQRLEKEINTIQELRWSEGGGGDFSFAEEYHRLKEQIVEAKKEVLALEQTQQKLSNAVGINTAEHIENLSRTNIELLQMQEYYKRIEQESMRLSNSVNGYHARIAELNELWNSMTASERESAEGSEIRRKYEEEIKALETEAQTLGQLHQKEVERVQDAKRAAEERRREAEKAAEAERKELERINNLRQKGIQSRRYENAILNSTVKTMRVLQEQERILSDRLNKTTFGSRKYKQLQADLEGVRAQIQALNGGLTAQSTILSNLSTMASTYVSLFGVLRLAKQIRDVTGELEYQRVALGHLIQDEEYGAKLFEQIKAAAIESPFRIKDLVTYTKQLAAYRIEQENLFDTTQRLADISAGLGVDMNRLILAFGQVRAASVLRGQELRQFTEAGIPLVELLAEKMGELNKTTYSTADVFKLISERAVPFSAIAEIFEDLTEKGGMFYEMQERQAETLKGRWEKLKDAFDIGLQTAGETKTFEWQNKLVLDILNILAQNINLVPKVIEALGYAWASYTVVAKLVNRRNKEIVKSNYELLSTEQLKQAGVSKTAISFFGEARASRMLLKSNAALAASNGFLAKTFARLRLAMLTNPYAAVAGAVFGLVSLFSFWNTKTKETTTSFDELDKSIEDVSQSTKKFNRAEKLIDRYKDLASKKERTTEENDKLQKTMSNLISLFPELADAITLENESLDKNVALLESRNKALLQQSKDRATASLNLARADLEKYNKEVVKADKEWAAAEAKAAAILDGKRYEELYKSQQKMYDELREQADNEAKKRDDAIKRRDNTAKRIETLERYLNPLGNTLFETAWQNTLARLKDVKLGEKTINLIGEEDIRGYESIYKALTKIDKAYKDSSNSLKEMRASLSSVAAEYREQAEEEIAVEQARRDGYKKILDTFGYISSMDKKKGVSDLTLLKEELKIVQDIYKRYQEFEKYLGKGEARRKIEEIYGNVTAIDFLDPESFKQRISTILKELRRLQGRITSGAQNITKEYFDDLKKTIKKNEGFREDAYKLAGEPYYTIGYGFYKNLPDGRKITKDMKLTREEADKLLDLGIETRIKYVNEQIRKYGEGLVLNEKQMNVLVDLAYQSAHGVERVLKEAGGDTNRITEALKSAASDFLVSNDADIKAGVKKRDMRRAEAFAKAMAEQTEDSDAVAQAVGEAEKLVQDVDWDEFKKSLDEKLKQVSDEIKRSEAARNFYKNILDLTGDEGLATTMTVSVYGGIGEDFKDRIKKQLVDSLSSLDANTFAGLDDAIRNAFDEGDYEYLMKNLEKVPEKLRDVVKQVASDAEKYNADLLRNFADLVSKYGDTAQKIATIRAKAENDIKKVKDALELSLKDTKLTPEERESLKKRADEVIKALEAQRNLDIFKASDDYIKFFAELNVMTADQAALVRTKLRDAYLKAFHDGAISADELSKNLRAIDTQFRKLTQSSSLLESYLDGGFDKANEKLQEYADNVAVLAQKMKSGKELSADEQNFATKMLSQFGSGSTANIESYQQLIQAFSGEGGGLEAAGEAFGQMGEGMSAMAANGPGALAIVDAIFKAVHATISGIQQIIDQLNEVRSEENKIGEWFKYISDFDRYTFSGWEKLKSGDAIGATVDAISSWISIFTNVQKDKVKKFNDQIKEQGTLLEDLEYEYSRLGVAIEKSSGSDYIANYNQQISVLQAQAEAYRKQAELERKKGKSADEDTAKGYEKSARDVEDQIADMQSQLSEFFTGSDLTSAARDFADAWIEAYKQFGNTTDAMKEKFSEMIENMVVNSLAAQLIQGILKPVFDQIDLASKDGELTAQEIGAISAMLPERMRMIDDSMLTMMNQLTSAGINLREQAGQFTGISRDIAGASEESITGLAAGINTQNFYISHIDANVAAILATLTGGASTAGASVTGEYVDPYKDQMLAYAAYIPMVHDEVATIHTLLSRVIQPRTAKPDYVLHTNL